MTIDDISKIFIGIYQLNSSFVDFASLDYLTETEVRGVLLKMLKLKIIRERIMEHGIFARPYVELGPRPNENFQVFIMRDCYDPLIEEPAVSLPETSRKQVETRNISQEARVIHEPILPQKRPLNHFYNS